MGCDIHLVAEIVRDGDWVPHPACNLKCEYIEQNGYSSTETCEVYIGRNYELFALMGHVARSHVNVQPMYPLAGLPRDCHDFTDRALSNIDYHSYSSLTFGQVLQVCQALGPQKARDLDLYYWIQYAKSSAPYVSEQRVVFAFDN